MITADFYPTTTTISGGNDDANYNTELTDILTSLTPPQDDFARAYYLYYVPWELVPPVYKASCAYVNNNAISARCITPPQNVAATFVGAYSTTSLGTITRTYTADYSVSNGAIVRNTTSNSARDYRLYNNYSIRKNSANVGFIGQTSSGGFFAIVGINPETGASSYSMSYTSNPGSGDENIEKFLNGELDFTISNIGYSGGVNMSGISFTIGASDIDEETGYYHFVENDIDFYVGINAYTINTKRDVNTQNGVTNYTNPAPALRLMENEHYHLRAAISGWGSYATSSGGGTSWYNGYVSINTANSTFTAGYFTGDSDGVSDYIVGDFNFDLSREEFNDAPTQRLWVVNKTILFKSSATVLRAFRLYTPSEIIAHLRLYQRASLLNQYVFSDDYKIPKYTETDSATTDFLVGDHETIGEFLRPWQDEYFKVSNFTPDDIPPYVPPGPTPGEDENTGTDIRRPTGLGVGGTNGFITQYALTASQIAEIGRLLWLNFTDADYYKNFLFALTTTGSIDISNLMDYFVSLRVYPFPLINVPSWAAAGQDMYIGAGVIPLHFSSTLHTINNYADYIDAGSCTVPRYFNDFRDFTHTQILLFLPYCGTVQLNPADVIGGTLYAQYAIDFASGGVNAYVDLATHDGRYFMIASLSGNIGADIPLTATNAAQIASKIAGDALNFAGTIGGAAAGDLGNRIGGAVSALTGNAIGVAGAAAGLVTQPIQGAASIAQEGMRIATSDGVKIPMLSGGRGFGSFGQPQTAYIQIRRGMYVEGQTAPQGFKHAFGEAYDQPVQVGSCSGYTVFDNIDTSGLSCTDAERAAIVKQMQQGIFI